VGREKYHQNRPKETSAAGGQEEEEVFASYDRERGVPDRPSQIMKKDLGKTGPIRGGSRTNTNFVLRGPNARANHRKNRPG